MSIHYTTIAEHDDDTDFIQARYRRSDARDAYRGGIKRCIDVGLTLMASPLVVSIVFVLALCIFLRDGRNPFYSQSRVGLGGRIFTMWKLRSMVTNADALLEQYLNENPEARAEWTSKQKLRNDPRITTLGAVLRKASLDELPQLWNVLKGDMSLVGPRPMMPKQQALYTGTAYFRMRPGVTGLWQISDRNDTAFARRVQFDNVYERMLSFRTDAKIILATIRVVLKGTGC
ncbi:sugar transferase [Roseobacter cerasinus]|uniref:Sugar transferase n=1 Tax=Roseobacter cerasinus TaxID=2602289 RepID=A0A640VWI2_9RHOB|nr:sugar transferase [Roseobacter cerasinus]GFE52503.1 sugar transferase [Roseobacter cerasinus]